MSSVLGWFRDFRDYVRRVWQAEWLPLSRVEAIGWMLFFLFFLWYAIGQEGGDFALLDSGNLVVHEGGHALFGHFGDFLGVAGGTILQLLVPLLLALAFHVRRQSVGYALFLLIVFENLLYVAKYMSDARAQAMSYVAIGVGAMEGLEDPMMHDWYNLFSRFGVLPYDTRIAAAVFKIGWAGMRRHGAVVRVAVLSELERRVGVKRPLVGGRWPQEMENSHRRQIFVRKSYWPIAGANRLRRSTFDHRRFD